MLEMLFQIYLCGAGSCGVATLESGRKFIGCEIDKKYFDVAVERIEEVIQQTPPAGLHIL